MAVHHGVQKITHHIRLMTSIYISRPLPLQSSPSAAVEYVERALKTILKDRPLWLCLNTSNLEPEDQSWIHAYYKNQLMLQSPLNHKTNLSLVSPTGEALDMLVQPLRIRSGRKYGWLLIAAKKGELPLFDQMYTKLILMKFEAYFDMNKQVKEIQYKAVANEREVVAQNIHDGIAQELFFLSIQLFQFKGMLQTKSSEELLSMVSEMEKRVKESHGDIRKLITELKGEKRRFNLNEAIEKMLHRIAGSAGVDLIFENAGWTSKENVEIEETIYHFIEEAANNVIKHAQANKLFVRLEVTSVQWTIVVKDDGVGLKNNGNLEQQGKFGMIGMSNRIKALEGSISVHSDDGRGTRITATIPRERSLTYV
ncbi:sensor histidine kinase [Paenibacillus lemnae]|uniref:sensor histidine kinase n=1 Tax=Paenibacillus lemnae TaxID=1330551 RepID=UPI00146A8F89|nr:ATP-binding protein [Paenibacillus lemnae]